MDPEDYDDDYDDFEDYDGDFGVTGDDPEKFRAFMSADERAFSGDCQMLLDELVCESLPKFADLIDEVMANGWTPEANGLADALGKDILHLTEHVASGFTPLAWIANRDFDSLTMRPASGKWIVPAVRSWMALASTEGLNGLLRSRLPWILPLTVEVQGPALGYAASLTTEIGVARLGDLSNFLVERGTLSQEDAVALIETLESKEEAIDLAGDLADMWFDILPDEDEDESETPAQGSLAFGLSDEGDAEFVDTSLDKWAGLVNDKDFSYDWASTASVIWLMLLSIQVLYREKKDKKVVLDGEEFDSPLMIEVASRRFWIFPDLDDSLELTVDPSQTFRLAGEDLEAARRHSHPLPKSEEDAGVPDPNSHPADQLDMDNLVNGDSVVMSLTSLEGHSPSSPPPVAEVIELGVDLFNLRAITIPSEFKHGNAMRITFHTTDEAENVVLPRIKVFGEYDEAGIQGSEGFLGAAQPGTGAANAKIVDGLRFAMNYLTMAHMDRRLLSDGAELWAIALMSLARSASSAAVEGTRLLATEHFPEATKAIFMADLTDNLVAVRLMNDEGRFVELSGSDLARRDAIYSDMEAIYGSLVLARQVSAIAAEVLVEEESDRFAEEWLPNFDLQEDGLALSLSEDDQWGSRLGTVMILP